MEPKKGIARVAGLLYFIVVATGIVSLAYVPSKLMAPGDIATTIANIRSGEQLFRLGIAAGLICQIAFLLLPLALYRLLAWADRAAGAVMVALAWASVPISFVNIRSRIDLLSLLKRPDFADAFGAAQQNAFARTLLESYSNGTLVVEAFWGLWLLPLGYLVMKSAAIPRILGALLILGGVGYVADVFGTLLFPTFEAMAWAPYVTKPAALGEIGTCLWLLVFGAKVVEHGQAQPR